MKPLEPKSLFARRYEVVRCISTGGMGAVYEVIHLDTKRRRALKVMLPNLLVDDEMRRRFALEAVITANVSSEHLIEVFDAGIEPDSGCPFLAMELLDGQDLGKQLVAKGPLPVEETIELLRQAARALDRTHAAGIVHRDLKPENLFVTRRDDGSPKIKILDFGIAKLLATAGGRSSRALGTPLFMAPEQVDDTLAAVGPAADLYAVGQIAFALLVGVPYFTEDAKRSDNVLGILLAAARGPIEKASVRAARRGVELPPGFDAWFSRATAREPEQRFGSAREMIEALATAVGLAPRATDVTRAPAREPEVATAKSADVSKPKWTSTELIGRPDPEPAKAASAPAMAISRPEGVETRGVSSAPLGDSRPISRPPIAASSTASLDPTVTSTASTPRRSRAPMLVALAVPAAIAIGYFALRDASPRNDVTGTVSQATEIKSATASGTAPFSNEPTVAFSESSAPVTSAASASAAPSESARASVSAATAKPVAEKRATPPKPSAAPPAATATSTNLPWEVRTPVKP